MRWTFKLALAARMRTEPRMYLIYGDVGGVMFADLRKEFPGRTLNFGVAEQAMVSFAAGMALAGWRPVVYAITPFLIERAFEQIKLDVDAMRLPVGLVGFCDGSGGVTHNSFNPRGMMSELYDIVGHYPDTKEEIDMDNMNLSGAWFLYLHE